MAARRTDLTAPTSSLARGFEPALAVHGVESRRIVAFNSDKRSAEVASQAVDTDALILDVAQPPFGENGVDGFCLLSLLLRAWRVPGVGFRGRVR